MSQRGLKGIGAACFVICAILLLVAWERFNSNAKAVEAANRMIPLGGAMLQLTGNVKLEPGVPAATTYSLLFAVLFAIGGVVCMVAAQKKTPASAGRDRETGGS